MSIQQAEGWHLWKKSMVMPRQALRRTVVSVPRRARLASVLVLLLTATGLLVTPTFGDSHEEIRGYGDRRMLEGIKRMSECKGNLDSVLKCQAEAYRIFEEGLQWCMAYPESCGTKAPVPVSCPDGYTPDPQGNCLLKPPKPEHLVSCPEGSMKETAKEVAEDLVAKYGIQGAYEHVNKMLNEERSLLDMVFGEREEKIIIADVSLLFLAIGAIESEEWRATKFHTEIGGTPFEGTARQVRMRKLEVERATDMEIGRLRTQSGFLASGFSAITQWTDGSKEAQVFWGHVGSLAGQGAEVFCDRVKNR
jgi:hypothetical protein